MRACTGSAVCGPGITRGPDADSGEPLESYAVRVVDGMVEVSPAIPARAS